MIRRLLALLIALCALVLPAIAAAHGRSTSYISWTIDGSSAAARLLLARIDHTALLAAWARAPSPVDAASALPADVILSGPPGPCRLEPSSFRELSAETGFLAFEWRVRCASEAGQTFSPTAARSDLFFDVLPAHVAFLRVRDVMHPGVESEHVLTDARREAALPVMDSALAAEPSSPVSTAARFVRAGIEHLLTGLDHLAFLLALLLAARSLRSAALALTGFTLGHSVTLSLAALGYAAPRTSVVEALIAASIALVAVENVWIAEGRARPRLPSAAVASLAGLSVVLAIVGRGSPAAILGVAVFEGFYIAILARSPRPDELRGVAASLFGLLHGFGFAGVLSRLDLGAGARIVPLLSFNVGIELGQLAIACAAWPLLCILRRRHDGPTVTLYGSVIPLSLGVYWFVSRTLNGY